MGCMSKQRKNDAGRLTGCASLHSMRLLTPKLREHHPPSGPPVGDALVGRLTSLCGQRHAQRAHTCPVCLSARLASPCVVPPPPWHLLPHTAHCPLLHLLPHAARCTDARLTRLPVTLILSHTPRPCIALRPCAAPLPGRGPVACALYTCVRTPKASRTSCARPSTPAASKTSSRQAAAHLRAHT